MGINSKAINKLITDAVTHLKEYCEESKIEMNNEVIVKHNPETYKKSYIHFQKIYS